MEKAFGIVNLTGNDIWVEGLQSFRTIGAFSFLGRYRIIDFPISNMSNSGIEHIHVYIRNNPRSLVEHLGTGRQYNINLKSGNLRLLFADDNSGNTIYNTDIAAFYENLDCIVKVNFPYVVIVPNYMIYTQNFETLLEDHISSGAEISLLYHVTDEAKDRFLNCNFLNLNRQKGVLSIEKNRGTAENRNIFMDTYVMKKKLLLELIDKARAVSSMYTLSRIVNDLCGMLDIRGISHRGYFAAITDFKSYYDANMELIDYPTAQLLFDKDWPIYTRTNDSCPTIYHLSSDVKNSVVSNGCIIDGSIENSVIGRGCTVEQGAVVKNCVLLPRAFIGSGVHLENQVVDKAAKILHVKELLSPCAKPGYIRRGDTL